MNESEGESQKWTNSPGYTHVTGSSPFKTPLSAKDGRTNKSRVSKEGRSCPPTPISNAGQKFFPLFSSWFKFTIPRLKSFYYLETAYDVILICFFLVVPKLTVSDDMQVPLPLLLLLVAVVMTVPQVILEAILINMLFTFHLSDVYDYCGYFYELNMTKVYQKFTGLLTKKFINLIKRAEDGILDLNKAAETLEVLFLYNRLGPKYLLLFLSVFCMY